MKKYLILLVAMFALASCNSNSVQNPTSTGSVTPTAMHTIPMYGSGAHKIEVFADFQCPACISAHKAIDPILKEYADAGKITIEYRQYPLVSLHQNAFKDAVSALCSAEQGQYVTFKDALYTLEEGKRGAPVTDEERIALAKDNGIDTEQFSECISNEIYVAQVNQDIEYGKSKGVVGTPTFFLDGKRIDMGTIGGIEGFRKILDSVTATGK